MAPELTPVDGTFLAALRKINVLADLPEDDLLWFASRCAEIRLNTGECYIKEGDEARDMFVILEGELIARTESVMRNEALFIARAGTVTGLLPYSRLKKFARTVRASMPTWAARYPKSGFPDLMTHLPELGARLVGVMLDRVRDLTVAEQQHEKMLALGRLSAGFAHELNNPVSATERASEEMQGALHRLLEANIRLDEQSLRAEQRKYIACAEREFAECMDKRPAMDPMERCDREDAVSAWLEKQGLKRTWEIAPTLVEMNWSDGDLEDLASRFERETLPCVLARLTATVTVGKLLGEIRQASSRISGLVRTLKDYSYMDQAPEQEVDLHSGLNTTLDLLHHRLDGGVRVEKDYDLRIPCIPCDPRALNQAWMNLMENALDAMRDEGRLGIRTRLEQDRAMVEVIDSGPGVAEKIRNRVFEPFFTTKPPGQGTGLGLDTVYRIVRQHNGDVTFDSMPGETRFRVRLPLHRQFGI